MTLRQKKREAKTYQLLSELMESLAWLATQKRWMGEWYENQNVFKTLACKPPVSDKGLIQFYYDVMLSY